MYHLKQLFLFNDFQNYWRSSPKSMDFRKLINFINSYKNRFFKSPNKLYAGSDDIAKTI